MLHALSRTVHEGQRRLMPLAIIFAPHQQVHKVMSVSASPTCAWILDADMLPGTRTRQLCSDARSQ